jgi:ribonuclease Z
VLGLDDHLTQMPLGIDKSSFKPLETEIWTGLELQFLGTSSATPTKYRNVSSLALRLESASWIFDCGEGTQHQLMKSNVRSGKIDKIFITHMHGDHIFGLPGLLCRIGHSCPPSKGILDIYGPLGLRKFVRTTLKSSASVLGMQYRVHELCPPRSRDWLLTDVVPDRHPDELGGTFILPNSNGLWPLVDTGEFQVVAGSLRHRVPCYGYVIQEKTMAGRLRARALQRLGLEPGPEYAVLKDGHSITLPDGSVVEPSEVLGPPRPGRKLVILGDTCGSAALAAAAKHADIIVHEATLENELVDKAIVAGHSTPGMAGAYAASIRAKSLVLTHFSARYKSGGGGHGVTATASAPDALGNVRAELPEDDSRMALLVREAIEAFGSQNVVAACDFLSVTVPRHAYGDKVEGLLDELVAPDEWDRKLNVKV